MTNKKKGEEFEGINAPHNHHHNYTSVCHRT